MISKKYEILRIGFHTHFLMGRSQPLALEGCNALLPMALRMMDAACGWYAFSAQSGVTTFGRIDMRQVGNIAPPCTVGVAHLHPPLQRARRSTANSYAVALKSKWNLSR